MKLIDVIGNWKETAEDFEVSTDTFEGFMEYFELTGNIMLLKSEDWGMSDFDGELFFHFNCGPSIGNGGVSDSIYIHDYLKKICNDLEIKIDLDIAENYHSLINLNSIAEADEVFEKLKKRIEQDFKIE